MRLINGITEKIEGWVFGIALKKGVRAAVVFLTSLIASAKIAPVLAQYGVSVDTSQLEVGLTAAGTAGLTILLNFLKTKYGLRWL